jgi:hypothetical protein
VQHGKKIKEEKWCCTGRKEKKERLKSQPSWMRRRALWSISHLGCTK